MKSTIFFLLLLFVLLSSCQTLWSQVGDDSGLESLVARAKKAQQSFQFGASTQLYRQAIEGYRKLGDACKPYKLHNEIAYNLLDLEEDDAAIRYIDSLIRSYTQQKNCSDTSLYLGLLLSQHIIYRDLNRGTDSKTPIDLALRLATMTGDSLMLAKIYNNYTAYYGNIGANYLALEYAEKSMSLKRKVMQPADPYYLNGLFTLANYTERIGNYESAYLYLDSVIQIVGTGDYDQLANTYHLMSLICYRRKDYAVAKKYAELSLDLFIKQSGAESRASSFGYQELGLANVGLKRYQEALQNFETGYKIRKAKYGRENRLTLSTLSQLVKTKILLGDSLASIDQYKKVVQGFIQHYSIGESSKYVLNLLEIGELYEEVGQIDSARSYYQKVWAIAQEYYPQKDRVHSQANTHLASVAPLEQRQHYIHLALFNLTGDSSLSQLNRSSFAFVNDKYAVLKVYQIHAQNLYALYENKNDPNYLEEILNLDPQFKLIKDEIFNQFLSTKSIIESAPIVREISLIRLRASFELYNKKKELKYLDHALRAMEESKNILLQTQIFEKNLKNLLHLPDSLVHEERTLYLEINDLDYNLNQKYSDSLKLLKLKLERQYFDLRRNILLRSTKLQNITTDTTFDLQSVQQKIDAESLLLDYFLDQGEIYILAIGKDFTHLSKQPFTEVDSKSLSELLGTLQHLPEQAHQADFRKSAYSFYKKLFPFSIRRNIKKLIIIPDNDLYIVPFDALLDEEPDEDQSMARLPFLVKKYQISYLSDLNFPTSSHIENNGQAVAFAPFVPGIDPSVINMPLLKYTDSELDFIDDIFQLQRYRGIEATEAQFKNLKGEYNILHIASHAIINNELPLQSNILFYPTDKKEDGKLQLWELYGMDIPAKIAVLSACKTSDGSLLKGAGVMNISRGFSTSGVSEVISNLWPVQDFAASQIMQTFYQNLKKSNDPSEALRLAKIKYLMDQDGPLVHPAYWAGWVVQYAHLQDSKPAETKYHYWILALLVCAIVAWFAHHKFT